ncbi:GGDEF domain-containing protein [Clostridium akagii]|uniref:GGDEF domain-containing protein n=1 Tax=Clostridium akagii TaxID=91623 RepID=UPI00047D9F59|nr:GGDEF domain-containing protein [Clostridium akagii]
MILLRKVVVFLFTIIFLVYVLCIKPSGTEKLKNKKYLFFPMILGLGLITIGTFIDMLSVFNNSKINDIIPICFTLGGIIFVVFTIYWTKFTANSITLLYKDAYYDAMTGLYNRRGIEEIFEKNIDLNEGFYVMIFDLDGTKMINDNLGHLIGDEYIVRSAKAISDSIRNKGVIGRIGGDEFLALLTHANEEEMEEIKCCIKRKVTKIFSKHDISVSIGVSVNKQDGESMKELFQVADRRMYDDKRATNKYKRVN